MSTQGNKNLKAVSNAGTGAVATDTGTVNQANNVANSEINTSGGLSPLVSKQLSNEQGLIGKSYTSAAQAANRGLAQRGMGVAPSGMSASLNNTAINNAGIQDTNLVGGAFGTQNQLNQTALNPVINAENAASGGINAATGANQAYSAAPSAIGDVGLGISGLAGLAGGVGSLMSGYGKMTNPGGSGSGSSGGSFGP